MSAMETARFKNSPRLRTGSGPRRTIFVTTPPRSSQNVSLIEHGACYYALSNGNVNLDNYEAELPYFPVRYREGIMRGRGYLGQYLERDAVDLVFVWEDGFTLAASSHLPLHFVSRCGPLTILANLRILPGTPPDR